MGELSGKGMLLAILLTGVNCAGAQADDTGPDGSGFLGAGVGATPAALDGDTRRTGEARRAGVLLRELRRRAGGAGPAVGVWSSEVTGLLFFVWLVDTEAGAAGVSEATGPFSLVGVVRVLSCAAAAALSRASRCALVMRFILILFRPVVILSTSFCVILPWPAAALVSTFLGSVVLGAVFVAAGFGVLDPAAEGLVFLTVSCAAAVVATGRGLTTTVDSALRLCELPGLANVVSEAPVNVGDAASSPADVTVEATLFLLPGGRPGFLPFAPPFFTVVCNRPSQRPNRYNCATASRALTFSPSVSDFRRPLSG